jgi:hypothetical protein
MALSCLRSGGLLPTSGGLDDGPRLDDGPNHLAAEQGERAGGDLRVHIECFYNPRMRPSSLGHLSPLEYEQARLEGATVVRTCYRGGLMENHPQKWGNVS